MRSLTPHSLGGCKPEVKDPEVNWAPGGPCPGSREGRLQGLCSQEGREAVRRDGRRGPGRGGGGGGSGPVEGGGPVPTQPRKPRGLHPLQLPLQDRRDGWSLAGGAGSLREGVGAASWPQVRKTWQWPCCWTEAVVTEVVKSGAGECTPHPECPVHVPHSWPQLTSSEAFFCEMQGGP